MEERILQALEGLNKRFDSLESRMDSLDSKVDSIQIQVNKNTQFLSTLEHSTQVNKAEHDRMFMDIAEVSGEVKGLRKDLSAVELITANNWSYIAKLKAVKYI